MPEDREHRVTPEESGQRLDAVLAGCWPDLSRARIQRLMKDGQVSVAGKPVRPKDTARTGETVTVSVPDPEPTHIAPEPIPLEIVYEDADLLVVNKPPGLVVHPGAGNRSGTLVNALVHHLPGLAAVGGVERPGIIHRLDKGTSGLLLVAKNDITHRRLTAAMSRREIKRTYQVLVWGIPDPPEGRMDAPIARHPRDRKRMAVVEGGREAATRYRVRQDFGWAAWVECELETGRTHQIRVHLGHIGHPALGDPAYGGGPRRALNLPQGLRRLARVVTGALQRPALHAARLGFPHPTTGSPVTLETQLPEDFAGVLEILRRSVESAPASSSRNPGRDASF
jgi:23S rRNA pseudouridine1911/1915/1917 synthase